MSVLSKFTLGVFGKSEKRGAVPTSDPQIARIFTNGISISNDLASKMATASRCISLVAGAYASSDQILYKQTKDGPVEADNHPLHSLLLNGTASLSGYELKHRLMESLLTHGESFAEIIFDDNGKPTDIIPHAWGNVVVEAFGNGRLLYRVSDPLRNYTQRVLTQDSMFHAKYRPVEYRGISPIQAASLSMDISYQTESAVQTEATSGFQASGMLSAPGAISDEAATRLKSTIENGYSGTAGRGKIIVAGDGLEWSDLSTSATDRQLLESRQWNSYQIAAAYGLPPESVGLVMHSSWSSSEESNRMLVATGLENWAQCLNQQLAAFVLSYRERRTLYIAADFSKMTSGNLQTKAAAYASLVTSGILTINESRSQGFDLGAIDGGDKLRVPLNTAGIHDPAKNGQQQAVGGAA
jgi:HK97 family phage portal protein